MGERVERRQLWSRIVGLERRGAPLPDLLGDPLPDPTRLIDEDFFQPQPHALASGDPDETGPHRTMIR
jgi:hypothetical protein